MKKTFFAVLLASYAIYSCGLLPFSRIGVTTSYSIVGDKSIAERKIRDFDVAMANRAILTSPIIDETALASRFRSSQRGVLVGSYTPQDFLLTFDNFVVYNRAGAGYTYSPLLGTLQVTESQTYSIKHSRAFIRDFTLMNGNIYQGFGFHTISGVKLIKPLEANTPKTCDGYHFSVVILDLGSPYQGILLDGEIPPSELQELPNFNPLFHYFEYGKLNPYNGDVFDSYYQQEISRILDSLMIGSDIYTPCFIYDNTTTSQNTLPVLGPVYTKPGPALDFSDYKNPEVILYWELEDLIEIYNNNTPSDRTDDIVTFRIANPFPVDVFIQESDYEQEALLSDMIAPGDVLFLGKTWWPDGTVNFVQHCPDNILLSWINPYDLDFKQVTVVRKAGSVPVSYTDGEIVYQGYRPTFHDETGVAGAHYYYLIYTEDFSGNKSPGIIADIVYPHDGETI